MPTIDTYGGFTCFTYSKEEWKTLHTPEKVFNILDYTFELPLPGPPPLKDGQGMSFKNYNFKPSPLDTAEYGRPTLPQGKVSNPALINELAEAAE